MKYSPHCEFDLLTDPWQFSIKNPLLFGRRGECHLHVGKSINKLHEAIVLLVELAVLEKQMPKDVVTRFRRD